MAQGTDVPLELPDATVVGAGELPKSGATRRRIVDAGVALLAEQGYRGFSAVAVAERSSLTRAAMLYHFPTRAALLAAVAHHIVRLRIDAFNAALGSSAVGALLLQADGGKALRSLLIRLTWDSLQSSAFQAYVEIVVAARTDPELRQVLDPALATYDRARRASSTRILPRDSYADADFALVRDVVRFLSEGLAGQPAIIEDRAERQARMRHFAHMLGASDAGSDFLDAVAADWAARSAAGDRFSDD